LLEQLAQEDGASGPIEFLTDQLAAVNVRLWLIASVDITQGQMVDDAPHVVGLDGERDAG
jgi:hypothetical protein